MTTIYKKQGGWTLIELVMVIAIIGILSSIAIRTFGTALGNSRFKATDREMDNISWAISGNPEMITASGRTDYGYVGDTGLLPPDLDALVSDPGVCGWDGPYIESSFGADTNEHKLDAWEEEYGFTIDQGRISISSTNAGTKILDDTTHLLYNTVQVQLYNSNGLPLNNSTGNVSIEYGCGWNSLIFNESTGKFTSNNVPIGMHRIMGIGGDDTTYNYVSIIPSSNVSLEMTTYPNFGTLVSNGCGYISGNGNFIVSEQISNNGSPTFVINKIKTMFFDGPCWGCDDAYLEKIIVDDATYWDYATTGTRIGTGTMVVLSELLFIPNGIATVDIHFNTSQSGVGGPIDMTGTPMSLELFPTNGSPQLVPFSSCGAGCNAPDLQFSPASATVTGTNKEIVSFTVNNLGDLMFNAIILSNPTWTAPINGSCWECGNAYLSRITSGGTIYWDYTVEGGGLRATSGNLLTLRNQLDLLSGGTPMVWTFNNALSGTGAAIDMSNTEFSVPFTSTCSNYGPTQTVNFTASGGAAVCSKCDLTFLSIDVLGNKNHELRIYMSNYGDDCEVTSVQITSSLTSQGNQPYVELISEDSQNDWTYQAAGARGSTTPGLETTMVIVNSFYLTQTDAVIETIQFSNSTGKAISILGANMTVRFTVNCCPPCSQAQEVSFTAN